jgi:hypothetical protein
MTPGQRRQEAPVILARVVQQKRHDVESVASAGANPAASTSLRSVELRLGKPTALFELARQATFGLQALMSDAAVF